MESAPPPRTASPSKSNCGGRSSENPLARLGSRRMFSTASPGATPAGSGMPTVSARDGAGAGCGCCGSLWSVTCAAPTSEKPVGRPSPSVASAAVAASTGTPTTATFPPRPGGQAPGGTPTLVPSAALLNVPPSGPKAVPSGSVTPGSLLAANFRFFGFVPLVTRAPLSTAHDGATSFALSLTSPAMPAHAGHTAVTLVRFPFVLRASGAGTVQPLVTTASDCP